MNKKRLNEIRKMKYNEENETIVLKELEDMEDNQKNIENEIKKDQKTVHNLKIVMDNDKTIAKQLKIRVQIKEDKIKSNQSLLKNWIVPTVDELNDIYLSFMEVKYEKDITKYIKELEKENKNSGK